MSSSDEGPPQAISYSLEDALELLAVLEDARETLKGTDHLTGVIALEGQVRRLSRKLDFDDPEGDAHDR
jgi:hypothetical protein